MKYSITMVQNVKIIYDSNIPEKRRPCYWESIEEQVGDDYKFHFVSIQDALNSQAPCQLLKLFDIKETQVIIINWDAINTDPVYGSDRTYTFFKHYLPDLNSWIEDGGVIILEAQTAAWKLFQDSYKLFDNKIRTFGKRASGKGYSAIINKKLKKQHPILKDLPEEIEVYSKGTVPKIAFPVNYNVCSIEHSGKRLFQGWFDKYSKDWEPLLFARINKKPIMLCRIVKNDDKVDIRVGGYIITTMYIGASNLLQLINNLLQFPVVTNR